MPSGAFVVGKQRNQMAMYISRTASEWWNTAS